jgi:hypothetical protein
MTDEMLSRIRAWVERRRSRRTKPAVPVAQAVADTPFTTFYDRFFYPLLIALGAVNVLFFVCMFWFIRQTAWYLSLTISIVTFGFLGALFSFVEDKGKIGVKKRLATLAVMCLIPLLAWAKDQRAQAQSSITDATDIAVLRSATKVHQGKRLSAWPRGDEPRDGAIAPARAAGQ